MKQNFYRHLLLFLLVPFTHLAAPAQDLTGIWKGYFISDAGEFYRLEFQVAQSSSNTVTGVSYSYLDVRFYGKATMTGNFFRTSSSFRIREIKTVEVKSTLGGATCIMNYNFKFSKSGKEQYLEGTYLGKYEPPYQLNPPGKWGDCGGGSVFLRKVDATDFYVEPFLRNKIKIKPVIDNQPPLKKDSLKTKPVTIPVKKPVVKNTTPPVKKPVVTTKTPEKKPITKTITTPVKKPAVDTTKITTAPAVKIPLPQVKTPRVMMNRTNELVKVLTINDQDVTVKLYDNGEIADDSISVYLDKRLVLSSKRLTASPLIVKFKLDEDNAEHELVMVAENMGRIPPNTSLMIVEAGEQRFDVRITSTEQKNAVVRFKYQKAN